MVHLNPDGKRSLGSGIAFTFVTSIAVGLRLLTKVYIMAAWAPDESWAVLSLVALFAWMGVYQMKSLIFELSREHPG